MKYFFERIVNSKIKLITLCAIFSAMIIDLARKLIYIPAGADPYQPALNTFLAFTGIGFNWHALVFWFLPLYLMLVISDDVFEDYKTGNINSLIIRSGKKRYVVTSMKKSFLLSFAMIFVPLIINLVMSYILFAGATRGFDFVYNDMFLLSKSMGAPLLTNFIFICTTSLLAAVMGCACTGIAYLSKDRKIAYPASFVLWFLFFIPRKSIMLSLQPFSEYELSDILPVYIACTLAHLAVAVVGAVWEINYAKK